MIVTLNVAVLPMATIWFVGLEFIIGGTGPGLYKSWITPPAVSPNDADVAKGLLAAIREVASVPLPAALS